MFNGGNMKDMMKQAQKMQQKILEEQKKLESETMEAQSGGGMVKVTVNGKKEIIAIEIAPEVVDPNDTAMLQDLIIAAVNEANSKMDEFTQEKWKRLQDLSPGCYD